MPISYTYKINAARVKSENSLADVVKEVDVTVTGTDGEVSLALLRTVALPTADPESFIQFDQLTEAQMVAWVSESSSLDDTKGHIAYVVDLELKRRSLEAKPLPWEPATPMPIVDL